MVARGFRYHAIGRPTVEAAPAPIVTEGAAPTPTPEAALTR